MLNQFSSSSLIRLEIISECLRQHGVKTLVATPKEMVIILCYNSLIKTIFYVTGQQNQFRKLKLTRN